ncbi:MAG: hypothetical protein ACHQQS_03350 [Thermoanaerobaculales bacterium]
MKKSLALAGVFVAVASISWGSIALNSSRSNIYRLVCPTNVATAAKAAAILKALDKAGPGVTEAKVRTVLTQQGVNLSLIKKIEIVPAAQRNEKVPAILLLADPADLPAALAATCPGCDPVRHPSSKPNL